jgi:hypothetical protein
MKNNSVTTVKVDKILYESFKIKNVQTRFYLQDLVNRCMYLYMNDEEFREKIYTFNIPVLSEAAQMAVLNITGSTNKEI